MQNIHDDPATKNHFPQRPKLTLAPIVETKESLTIQFEKFSDESGVGFDVMLQR